MGVFFVGCLLNDYVIADELMILCSYFLGIAGRFWICKEHSISKCGHA
jgi:positive regulator of sigma E activity